MSDGAIRIDLGNTKPVEAGFGVVGDDAVRELAAPAVHPVEADGGLHPARLDELAPQRREVLADRRVLRVRELLDRAAEDLLGWQLDDGREGRVQVDEMAPLVEDRPGQVRAVPVDDRHPRRPVCNGPVAERVPDRRLATAPCQVLLLAHDGRRVARPNAVLEGVGRRLPHRLELVAGEGVEHGIGRRERPELDAGPRDVWAHAGTWWR